MPVATLEDYYHVLTHILMPLICGHTHSRGGAHVPTPEGGDPTYRWTLDRGVYYTFTLHTVGRQRGTMSLTYHEEDVLLHSTTINPRDEEVARFAALCLINNPYLYPFIHHHNHVHYTS